MTMTAGTEMSGRRSCCTWVAAKMPAPNSSATPNRTTTPRRSDRRVMNATGSAPFSVAEVLDQEQAQVSKLDQLVRGEPLCNAGLLRRCVPAHRVDSLQARFGDYGLDPAAVGGVGNALDQSVPFQDIDDVGHRSRRHVHPLRQRAQRQLAARAVAKAREHTKAALREGMAFGETLHRIVDSLRSQSQRAQSFENLDRTLTAGLDHSASHRCVVQVSRGVDGELSQR